MLCSSLFKNRHVSYFWKLECLIPQHFKTLALTMPFFPPTMSFFFKVVKQKVGEAEPLVFHAKPATAYLNLVINDHMGAASPP